MLANNPPEITYLSRLQYRRKLTLLIGFAMPLLGLVIFVIPSLLGSSILLVGNSRSVKAPDRDADEFTWNVYTETTSLISRPNSSLWIELITKTNTLCLATVTNDDYLYVGAGSTLAAYNVTEPSHPIFQGQIDLPTLVRDIDIEGDTAYVAAGDLYILDVSDPTNPVQIGYYDTPGGARGVSVLGDYAYVADGALRIVDISGITPTGVGSFTTPFPFVVDDVAISSTYAYLADGYGGLRVVNVATSSSPSEIGYTFASRFPRSVTIKGHYVTIAGGLSQGWVCTLDVQDVSDLSNSACINLASTGFSVVANSNYAYVGYGSNGGVEVVSLTSPLSPRQTGYYGTEGGGRAIATSKHGNYIYLCDDMGFFVLRFIPNPVFLPIARK